MINILSKNELNVVSGGGFFDKKFIFYFSTITLGGITGLQSLVRETYEQGTGREFIELPQRTRNKILTGEYVGGLAIAAISMYFRKKPPKL